MEFTDFVRVICDKLNVAQTDGNMNEYARLLILLRETVEDTIKKVEGMKK